MTEEEKADRERKQVTDEQVSLLDEAERLGERSERFFRQIQIDKEEGDRLRKEGLDARVMEDDITDPRQRYLDATKYYDLLRPERSLAEMAIAEGAEASREWHRLDRQAMVMEKQGNIDEATDIRFRRDINHAEYMQITTERLIGISEYVNPQGQQVESYKASLEYWTMIAADLRSERLDHHAAVELKQVEQIDQRVEQREIAGLHPTRPENVSDKFEPTPPDDTPGGGKQREEVWRPVQPDEVQQPGVHARMNIESGQTEVRVDRDEEVSDRKSRQLDDAARQYHAQEAAIGQREADHSNNLGNDLSY